MQKQKNFRSQNRRWLSIGKFDGLHVGHQKLVREMVRWKEKGLKVAMFTFSTPPLSLVGGRKQTVLMTNREPDGAPALGRGGLSGGISL